MSGRLYLRAPAKINWCLEIAGGARWYPNAQPDSNIDLMDLDQC